MPDTSDHDAPIRPLTIGDIRTGRRAQRLLRLEEATESARVKSDAPLAVIVAAVHQRSRKVYGSPRVHEELKPKASASDGSASSE